MDDILKRLSNVESAVAAISVDVSALKAIVPHLATEARLSAVEGSLTARISGLEGSLTAKISALETSIIKWLIGTVISSAAVAFAFAKYVN